MKAPTTVSRAAQAAERHGPPRIVVTRGWLSCITTRRTARGKWIDCDYFDVPNEDYGDGCLTGQRLAAELVRALATGSGSFDAMNVVAAAGVAWNEPCAGRGRRGAGVGFLRALEPLLVAIAAPGVEWIDKQLECGLRWRREEAERRQTRRHDFARRMEIAKAAKARARCVLERAARHG